MTTDEQRAETAAAIAAIGERDPDALQLVNETTEAINQAILTAGVIITTVKGRKLNTSDLNALTNAGMSGWDCAIFKIVGDELRSQDFRGKAIKLWAVKRSVAVESARQMARAIIG